MEKERPTWDEYFTKIVQVTSERSPCHRGSREVCGVLTRVHCVQGRIRKASPCQIAVENRESQHDEAPFFVFSHFRFRIRRTAVVSRRGGMQPLPYRGATGKAGGEPAVDHRHRPSRDSKRSGHGEPAAA